MCTLANEARPTPMSWKWKSCIAVHECINPQCHHQVGKRKKSMVHHAQIHNLCLVWIELWCSVRWVSCNRQNWSCGGLAGAWWRLWTMFWLVTLYNYVIIIIYIFKTVSFICGNKCTCPYYDLWTPSPSRPDLLYHFASELKHSWVASNKHNYHG